MTGAAARKDRRAIVARCIHADAALRGIAAGDTGVAETPRQFSASCSMFRRRISCGIGFHSEPYHSRQNGQPDWARPCAKTDR
jgi:hypothetical protein